VRHHQSGPRKPELKAAQLRRTSGSVELLRALWVPRRVGDRVARRARPWQGDKHHVEKHCLGGPFMFAKHDVLEREYPFLVEVLVNFVLEPVVELQQLRSG
jgi:hypothetical protein